MTKKRSSDSSPSSRRSVLVTGLQKTIWVPHLPDGTCEGRGITLPPRFLHWLKVAHHFEVRLCRADARSKSSGLIPRYAFLLMTLEGEPALGPTRQGRRQGGTPPDSRAAMIWLVMVSRTCCWLAMLASGSVVVGYQRPARRCRGTGRGTHGGVADGYQRRGVMAPRRDRGGEGLITEGGPDSGGPTPAEAL